MHLFITGGAGFIGSNFVRMALERGYSVLNFDALTYAGNLANLEELPHAERYTFVHGSICDERAIATAIQSSERFDACINFAAESHVDRSIDAAHVFAETNVLGTVVLLEAMRRAGVERFVHISTDEVYGSADNGGLFTLDSPIKPSSPYSASKAAADHFALSCHHTYGYDVRVTRCTNNYGPNQYPEKFIPNIIVRALRGESVPIYGDGKQIRDWIFVRDHCEGIFAALERGKPGGTYLFGGSSEVENLSLARIVLEEVANARGEDREKYVSLIAHVSDRPGHDRRYAIDWSNSQRELGWSPATNFETGLRETVRWYLAHPEWTQPLVAQLRRATH